VTKIAPSATTNSWLIPVAPTQPPSVSERLVRALEAHANAEATDLATCQRLAKRSSNPVVQLLVGLVVQDEQRHHSLLRAMVSRLQQGVEHEHEAAHHLRHIAHQEPRLLGGLDPLLLETMARDSEKHAAILRFLLTRFEEYAR
jgi:rubrerythrin